MSSYEVRLHKRSKSNKSLYDVVNCVTFEAADDNHARQIAPTIPVPRFKDSDLALVFSSDDRLILRLFA
jgi:hypothetical protein